MYYIHTDLPFFAGIHTCLFILFLLGFPFLLHCGTAAVQYFLLGIKNIEKE